MTDVYACLNNIFVKWEDTCVEQIKLAQNDLCNFFKYSSIQFESCKEVSFKFILIYSLNS